MKINKNPWQLQLNLIGQNKIKIQLMFKKNR